MFGNVLLSGVVVGILGLASGPLRIAHYPENAPGSIALSWASELGQPYDVLATERLGGEWRLRNDAPIVAAGTEAGFVDTIDAGSRFYRLATNDARLPEGFGLAAGYPGDLGIEEAPGVIFVEDFEAASVDEVTGRWENVKDGGVLSLSSLVPPGSTGNQSLLMTHIGGQGTGGHLYRRLEPGHDQVFARFYVRFDPDCAPIHHFGTHLGGFNPSTPWPQGGAGIRPEGDKRFTTGIEPHGENWNWDFYTYWQGMHVHGDGNYWGTPFLAGIPKPAVDRGRWICVEMMVRVNDPVEAQNGEQAFWIDGRLWRHDGQVVSHVGPGFPRGRWTGGWWSPDAEAESSFEGFQWRTVPELAVNYVWTYLYITGAPNGHVSKVWFDHIVIANEYIGPIHE